MKSPKNKLTLKEREYLIQLLQDQLNQEAISAEEVRRKGIDREGSTYNLGGKSQGVLVNESGIPRVISEEHTMFLDCGHAINSPTQVLGKCDNGHIICNLHDHSILRCVECGKLLCHLCAIVDGNGNFRCASHGAPWGTIILIAGIILVALFVISRL